MPRFHLFTSLQSLIASRIRLHLVRRPCCGSLLLRGPYYSPRTGTSFVHRLWPEALIGLPPCVASHQVGQVLPLLGLTSSLSLPLQSAARLCIPSAHTGYSGRWGHASFPGLRIIRFLSRQHGPEDTRMFVGDSHQGLVVADACEDPDNPALHSACFVRCLSQSALQCAFGALYQL